ncbi:MAG: hypothetical protein FJ267_06330, partial [Planctomycetes bacterium]|nr:hypothetical protein [Planctomycetota bacterium]
MESHGIQIPVASQHDIEDISRTFFEWINRLGFDNSIVATRLVSTRSDASCGISSEGFKKGLGVVLCDTLTADPATTPDPFLNQAENHAIQIFIRDDLANRLAPDGDTQQLADVLRLDTRHFRGDVEKEILSAMLLCPIPIPFPSFMELESMVRMRMTIVESARKTRLAFSTHEAERPEEYWFYDDDRGFIIRPGKSLITALEKATQPDEMGTLYSFSCRRAGEYLIQLATAKEAATTNPNLYCRLCKQAESRAVKGTEFESLMQGTLGSPENPLPPKFFIPGDRTWFRNPDEYSANVVGFEGSWTFYLGSGEFADFWRKDKVYSLVTKCLTIFHWRHGVFKDDSGELQIDERKVESLVEQTLATPGEADRILADM